MKGPLNPLLQPPAVSTLSILGSYSTCDEINFGVLREEAASLPLGWLTHTQQALGGGLGGEGTAAIETEHV